MPIIYEISPPFGRLNDAMMRGGYVIKTSSDLPLKGQSGTYALFFWLPAPMTMQVGRLGSVQLPAGWLVYVGSALGPGGLQARIRRHLATSKRVHWHIDALSIRQRPAGWLALADAQNHECDWAQHLAAHPKASIPVPGFGNSDCKRGCAAHLIAFPTLFGPEAVQKWLIAAFPEILTKPVQVVGVNH